MTTWLIMQKDFQKRYLRNYAPSIFWILGKLGTLELIRVLYSIYTDKYTLGLSTASFSLVWMSNDDNNMGLVLQALYLGTKLMLYLRVLFYL